MTTFSIRNLTALFPAEHPSQEYDLIAKARDGTVWYSDESFPSLQAAETELKAWSADDPLEGGFWVKTTPDKLLPKPAAAIDDAKPALRTEPVEPPHPSQADVELLRRTVLETERNPCMEFRHFAPAINRVLDRLTALEEAQQGLAAQPVSDDVRAAVSWLKSSHVPDHHDDRLYRVSTWLERRAAARDEDDRAREEGELAAIQGAKT